MNEINRVLVHKSAHELNTKKIERVNKELHTNENTFGPHGGD